jgi:predicted amidohydrolase YtcJ
MLALLACTFTVAAPADLVIENAKIWSDGFPGFAEFAAVTNGRFVHVGRRIPDMIGPNTKRIDAKGQIVIPGLVDSHVHMLGGGTNLSQLQLRDAKDKAEFIQRVEDWTTKLAPGKWVLGGRWSVESWAVRDQPTKEWVDAVTGDRPLYLSRMDGHSALVNSAALKLAGITREGPADPAGGVIDRDPNGEPTGILRETAMSLVSRHIPSATFPDKVAALKKAMAHANSYGITAVSDIPSLNDLPAYERLAEDKTLTVRFSLYPTPSTGWISAATQAKHFKGAPGWVSVRGFKAYFDGSLGSRTAYMHEPFLGNPDDKKDWRGLPRPEVTNGVFLRDATSAWRAKLQTIAHAIGDEANHLLLNQLSTAYPNLKTARCRSEHAQHLLPSDIPRFGQLGVIASMQPYHKADDGRYAESYIGEARSRSSYAFRSLLNGGAVLAFGSDWPVVSINPFLGMEAAVTGKIMNGQFWQVQENISVLDALRSYTSQGAYAMFMETEIGKIAGGFRADFVVLDRNPFDAGVAWAGIRPLSVYVEGREVYKAQ